MNLTPEWQTKRSHINHQWLKNQFIGRLQSLMKLPNDRLARENVDACLTDWNQRSFSIENLIDSLPCEMSPARLFEQNPLCALPDEEKAWMASLLEKRWMENNQIEKKCGELHREFDILKKSCQHFSEQFEHGAIATADIDSLRKHCESFSSKLSVLKDLSVLP